MTEERLREICSKYGTIQHLKLKTTTLPDGSIGKVTAEVFYSKKEEAGLAMQKLYFENELGDNLNVDYYKLKEARIQEHDKQNDVFR